MKSFLFMCCSVLVLCCSRERAGALRPETEDTTQAAGRTRRNVLSPTLTYEQRQGEYLYLKYCGVCHGEHGGADGFNTYNLDPKPHSLADSAYVAALSDAALTQVIALGGQGVNRSVLMPAYQWTLNKNQITYLVSYVRVLPRDGKGE